MSADREGLDLANQLCRRWHLGALLQDIGLGHGQRRQTLVLAVNVSLLAEEVAFDDADRKYARRALRGGDLQAHQGRDGKSGATRQKGEECWSANQIARGQGDEQSAEAKKLMTESATMPQKGARHWRNAAKKLA